MFKMKLKISIVAAAFIFTFLGASQVSAQQTETAPPPVSEFYKALVLSIESQGEKDFNGIKNIYQEVTLKVLDGPDKDKIIKIDNGGTISISAEQKVKAGETVVLTTIEGQEPEQKTYMIADKYRLSYLPFFVIAFIVLVLIVTGLKGVGSLLGLIISFAVIAFWIVPQIIQGHDPLGVSIVGSLVILIVTTYLAHGISKQTTVAFVATFISLCVTALLAIVSVGLTKMTGMGSEESYSLQFNPITANINTKGLLLGGVIIGTLGALNDVTTTQAATIFELAKSEKNIKLMELAKRGFGVGKEHILSMVNTLLIAYAGSSLVIFIILALNPQNHPLWVVINTETIFGEIIRAVVGSFGLILAVPLVTVLASWYLTTKKRPL